MRESAADAKAGLRPKAKDAPSATAPFKSVRLSMVLSLVACDLVCGRRGVAHLDDPLRPGPDDVHHGGVIVNLL